MHPSGEARIGSIRLRRRDLLAAVAIAGVAPFGGRGRASAATMLELRQRYADAAELRAFGEDRPSWDPEAGYRANRATLFALYDYYRELALIDPVRFLWAGIARMAGGTILRGLDVLVDGIGDFPGLPDPGPVPNRIVALGKQIFEALAWQHEFVLAESESAMDAFRELDQQTDSLNDYGAVWSNILSPTLRSNAADGNLLLFENEQYNFVQPAYDEIVTAQPRIAFAFSLMLTPVHPYHRSFLETVPGGNATRADDRWRWIAGPGGMWETWLAIPPEERVRLVCLDLEATMAQEWGALLPEFTP